MSRYGELAALMNCGHSFDSALEEMGYVKQGDSKAILSQRDQLASALLDILIAAKAVNPMFLNGPELLMHGADYAKHLEAGSSAEGYLAGSLKNYIMQKEASLDLYKNLMGAPDDKIEASMKDSDFEHDNPVDHYRGVVEGRGIELLNSLSYLRQMMDHLSKSSASTDAGAMDGVACADCGWKMPFRKVDKIKKEIQPADSPTEYEHGNCVEVMPCKCCASKNAKSSADAEGEGDLVEKFESIEFMLNNEGHFGLACASHFELNGSTAPIMALTVLRNEIKELKNLTTNERGG